MQNQVSKGEEGAQMKESSLELTFEQVCPIWSSKLKSGLNEKDMVTMRNDSKYCMVGEAWGFTGRHAGYYIAPLIPFVGCWTCVIYNNQCIKYLIVHISYFRSDYYYLQTILICSIYNE
jgi:hypothetical protein